MSRDIMSKKEFAEIYEADGHTGLAKCRHCGRIDTDVYDYIEIEE